MKNRNTFRFSRAYLIVFIFLAAFGVVLNAQVAFADISVDSYLQVTIQTMQQEASSLQDLISLANQYSDDPSALAQQEGIKKAENEQAQNALYASAGTTARDYVYYMGKHKKDVDKYLNDNPTVKQQIDDLAVQLNSLLDEYETLKASIEASATPLP